MRYTYFFNTAGWKKMRFWIIKLSLLAMALPIAAQTDVVETITKSMRFGDWVVRCEQQNQSQADCVMNMQILDKQSGKELVQANFAKHQASKESNQEALTLMTLRLPLGIFLPNGMELEIKDHKKFSYDVTFCDRSGCFVNEYVDKEMIDLLRKKEVAMIRFFANNQQIVELPFSISGFLDAYKQL